MPSKGKGASVQRRTRPTFFVMNAGFFEHEHVFGRGEAITAESRYGTIRPTFLA